MRFESPAHRQRDEDAQDGQIPRFKSRGRVLFVSGYIFSWLYFQLKESLFYFKKISEMYKNPEMIKKFS